MIKSQADTSLSNQHAEGSLRVKRSPSLLNYVALKAFSSLRGFRHLVSDVLDNTSKVLLYCV